MRKGLLTLALVAGSLLGAQAQSAAPVKAIVKPGETQWLAIQLQNPDVAYTAFEMDITLPKELTFADGDGSVVVKRPSIGAAPHKAFYNMTDGVLKVVAFSASSYEPGTAITAGNENFSGKSGDLLLVKVVPSEGVDYKDVQLSVNTSGTATAGKARFVTEGLEEVTLDAYVAGLLGDVNGDNKITSQDASLVLQNSVGKLANDEEGYEVEVANANGDSSVTSQDASLILQYSVGKITSFE